MKLWDLVGKKVRLILNDGKVVDGIILDWTDDYTSISGQEEITVGNQIYAESDFKSIEIIKE